MVDFKAAIHEQRHIYDLYQAGDAEWLSTPPTAE